LPSRVKSQLKKAGLVKDKNEKKDKQ